MSTDKWLLMPVVLHFFLVVAIGGFMGNARFRSGAEGRFKRSDIINNSHGYPPDVKKIGDNFNNQFQLPVCWYACVAFVMITGVADVVLIALSWVFLGSRILHTINHTGVNTLPNRFYFYFVGFVALAIMWAWFAIRYFLSG